jgi:hypothetical protein
VKSHTDLLFLSLLGMGLVLLGPIGVLVLGALCFALVLFLGAVLCACAARDVWQSIFPKPTNPDPTPTSHDQNSES